jgi:hypothetical protein
MPGKSAPQSTLHNPLELSPIKDIVGELPFVGYAVASEIGLCDPSGEYRSRFEWFVG